MKGGDAVLGRSAKDETGGGRRLFVCDSAMLRACSLVGGAWSLIITNIPGAGPPAARAIVVQCV